MSFESVDDGRTDGRRSLAFGSGELVSGENIGPIALEVKQSTCLQTLVNDIYIYCLCVCVCVCVCVCACACVCVLSVRLCVIHRND